LIGLLEKDKALQEKNNKTSGRVNATCDLMDEHFFKPPHFANLKNEECCQSSTIKQKQFLDTSR